MLENVIRNSEIEVISGIFFVARLAADAAFSGPAFMISRESWETTVILPQEQSGNIALLVEERDFRILRINIPILGSSRNLYRESGAHQPFDLQPLLGYRLGPAIVVLSGSGL